MPKTATPCPYDTPDMVGRHRRRQCDIDAVSTASSHRATRVITLGVLGAIAAAAVGTAAPAMADPGGQGGFTTPGTGQGQGGFTTPTTGQGGFTPAPSPRGSAIPTLPEESTPLVLPVPSPQTPPAFYGPTGPVYYSPPATYSTSYSSAAPAVLHAPRPTPVPRTILAPVGYIRIGNYITRKPAQLSNADAAAINQNAGVAEGKIAQFWESVGLPKDQAARRGAAAVTGGAAGAAIGFTVLAAPAAIGGALLGTGIGAAIGAFVPPYPFNIGTGALIGAGSGAAAIGLGAGVIGAIGGGIIGAVVGDQVGAGDPGANPNAPTITPGTQTERPYRADPPNPTANQYELHLDRKNLPGGGKVDYVVAKNGDVTGRVTLGAINVPIHINHTQADAPFKAAGLLAQTARDTVSNAVADFSRQAQKAFPGLHITFPQLTPPARR
ncbi:hypothetical protein [Williamsia sp. CHRR-6]|uniref:hypothetical protein n=1 Tax=Williamsia sp. CHRR-6 TaxID=2835871 RepID=UPI001BD9CAA3|nr:hypothetical protein [Williamsia sp. CHRR-6]MBT0568601.1 hypothetical protein [Williamsia sp. CHRR-6]